MSASEPLLRLDRLVVEFGSLRAVNGVSLEVRQNERLGIVGESGSGKSVSLLAALGLLPEHGRVVSGTARFNGTDLITLDPDERRRLLGRDIAMVFQNPATSLNPVMSVGAQLVEGLRIHDRSLSRTAARSRAVELLDLVGIRSPKTRVDQYPHEFSGGMCQRVMIAMAISNRPQLLLADEPTTAVDATTQAQLLALLRSVSEREAGATVLVSHDLGVISENTDRVVVMYGGRVMEEGPTAQVLASPQHPYTQGLLSCRPEIRGDARLIPIPGQPPSLANPVSGCPFHPRCPVGRDDPRCASEVPLLTGSVACHHPGSAAFPPIPHEGDYGKVPRTAARTTLLKGAGVRVHFPTRRRNALGKRSTFPAVADVDLEVQAGEAVGLVGESGSGKSTLARTLIRLINPSGGTVAFSGADITRARRSGLRELRDQVQIVFQDPFNALNPRLAVGAAAAEPLRLRGVPAGERRERVLERFDEVGLAEEHYDRQPWELSGGQLQRVGIARALVLEPRMLVLDEPVSALDVSVQAQILNLLKDLKDRHELAYLFISHDMAVVRYLCDRVAVMRKGEVVEMAGTSELFAAPEHEYTRELLAAASTVNREEP